MMTTHKSTPLFGGAITASLPTDFGDARQVPHPADLRDIPSNQEVYLQATGFTTIIIEILEYAAPPEHPCATDEEALKYHYADMVAAGHVREGTEDEEETRFLGACDVRMDRLTEAAEGRDARVMSMIGAQTPRGGIEGQKTVFTALLMTLVRLEGKGTDLLITVSVPHLRGEYDPGQVDLEKGKWGPLIERGLQIRSEIWGSFEIKDWGLFDG